VGGGAPALLAARAAAPEPVARAMAEGARHRAGVALAVAVTGIAGPTGATPGKPVGTVWLAWAMQGEATQAVCHVFQGDRAQVRQQTCEQALQGLVRLLGAPAAPP
jgi:nicotinamide-nucleotide amidase